MTNRKTKKKVKNFLNNNKFLAIIVLGLLVVGSSARASVPVNFWDMVAGKVAGKVADKVVGSLAGPSLGSAELPDCATADDLSGCPSTFGALYAEGAMEVNGAAYFDGAVDLDSTLDIQGTATLRGQILATSTVTLVANTTSTAISTTTITSADSGEIYSFATVSSTIFVLPATSTSQGVLLKFVVGGALSTDVTIQTSDRGDNIEGALIVAGAVVDCDAEDTITFVSDGENIGDFVELLSDGTYWHIVGSGGLTAAKITCTTT